MDGRTTADKELVAAARRLRPQIRAQAAWIDAERRLPDQLVQAIAAAGLFRLTAPRDEGGADAGLATALRVIEEVARADGSTGWCVAMGINTIRHGAQFSPAVRHELFHSDPVGVSSGSANSRGTAEATDGGFIVNGHWLFASGCTHASTLHGACRVLEDGAPRLLPNGVPEERMVYFSPKSVVDIIDTWDTSGLRGTGSHDIVVRGLYVPEERTFLKAERRARVSGAVTEIPAFDIAGLSFACVGLGIARAAIDELVDLAQTKLPRAGDGVLRDRAFVQGLVGEAEATLRSARALLFETVEDLQGRADSGAPIGPEQRALTRLAMTHAAAASTRAAAMMSTAAGTTSIYRTSPLERYARDAEAVTRHFQLQPVNYEAVGRTVLGLESSSPLF